MKVRMTRPEGNHFRTHLRLKPGVGQQLILASPGVEVPAPGPECLQDEPDQTLRGRGGRMVLPG